MTVKNFAKSQLLQSMLSGIPQIIRVRGRLRKVLKSLVLIFCLQGCLFQIGSFMKVFWSYPIIVDVFVSNPSRTAAPAFTICEHNGIRRSSFCKKFSQLCTPKMSYYDFCMVHFQYCRGETRELPRDQKIPTVPPQELPTNVSSLRTLYRKMGTSVVSFVASVGYGKGKEDLRPKRVSVFNFQGLPTNCFAYNTLWMNGSAILKSERQRASFEISLKTNDDENFYFSTPEAIQMAVHSPFMKVNPFTDGFSVRPCTTYKMYLQKTKKYLLPSPYPTNCLDYETLWRTRGGKGPLNQKMCVDECVFNVTMEKYGCFNPIEVTYPNDDAPFCYMDVDEEVIFEDCNQYCRAACYEEEMQVKMEEFVFPDTEEGKKSGRCLTGITLSFARTQVMTFTYSQKYQDVEVFSYIGGFLGMWLGLSLIAVFDFLETCLMIFIYICKRLKFTRKKNKTSIKILHSKKMYYI